MATDRYKLDLIVGLITENVKGAREDDGGSNHVTAVRAASRLDFQEGQTGTRLHVINFPPNELEPVALDRSRYRRLCHDTP